MPGVGAELHARIEAPPGPVPRAVIGPNIVIRTAEALTQAVGADRCARVFGAADLARYVRDPPDRMVSESEVAALYRALAAQLGEQPACAIAWEAGRLTGDYLLANRIPRLAQRVLARLPRRIAARILLGAIARHAWTFAGSGQFSYAWMPALELRIAHSPLCSDPRAAAPVRRFYAGAFERVLAAMLGPRLRVEEAPRSGPGSQACLFYVHW